MQQMIEGVTSSKERIHVNWRPFVKAVVKSGFLLVRNVQAMSQVVYLEANKIVMEAKSELDRDEQIQSKKTGTGVAE